MTSTRTIALDAMGGDAAPQVVVEGSNLALETYPNTQFLMFGDQAAIAPVLSQYPRLESATTIQHTETAVTPDDRPSQALRRSRDSSMGLALQAVRDGRADVAVSAGNTGALMAMAKFMLKTLPGIERPALIGFLPTERGFSAMLDLGANVECDEDNLVQFSIMGAAFASAVLSLERPTVGLLNVGVEELKGNEVVRTAADKLRAMDLPFEFSGFVEGNSLGQGTVDVFVADGFTGNITLKATEGIARFISGSLREAFHKSLVSRIGYLLSARSLRKLRNRLDPNNYNGGVFLGLNGLVVKSHGSASAYGFANAIEVAVDMVRDDMIAHISGDLERLGALAPRSKEAAVS